MRDKILYILAALTICAGCSDSVDFNPDEFAESKTIIWESSDENIVKVENGKVTAVIPGTATITATTVNGKTDSITVTVPVVKATTLTINKNNTSIEKGNTEQCSSGYREV